MRRPALPARATRPRQRRAGASGGGRRSEEILNDYPSLEDGDITASLEYAARQSDRPVFRVA